MENLYTYIDNNLNRFIEELFSLVRQPSVSTDKENIQKCAELVASRLEEVGAESQIITTKGNSIVFGRIKSTSSRNTLLIYGHYDVKSPGDHAQWASPPFEPAVRGERMYGRGISDNKSGVLAHIKAVEALQKTREDPGINVKFVFEGEEEIGSPSLKQFVEENRDILRSDAFIRADGEGHETGRPIIRLGNKGMLTVELEATMANRDLHSSRAAVVPSPVWEIIWALSSMKDRADRVLIEGFYDGVRPITSQERELLQRMPTGEQELLESIGLNSFIANVRGVDYAEKLLYSPTFNLSGIQCGGPNPLPHKASVILEIRLTPDQDPTDIFNKLVRHIERNNFKIKATKREVLYPDATRLDSPFIQIVIEAVKQVWKKDPIIQPRGAGSGPYYYFANILGIPLVSLPFSPFDCNAHAANENVTINGFANAIKVTATILKHFAQA